MNQINLIRLTPLVCDRANRTPVAAIVPIHTAVATVEVEVVSAEVNALVGSRTPIGAEIANADTRRPVAVARSRKKYTIAVRTGYFHTIYTILCRPCPSAVIS